MRILIIGSELHFPPTNMESQMVGCLRDQSIASGFEMRALSIRINKPAVKDRSLNYVHGFASGPLALRKPFYALELLFRLEQELRRGVDIIHFIWVGFPYLTQWMIRRIRHKKIKIVYSVLSCTTPPERYKGVDRIVVQTSKTFSRYRQSRHFEKKVHKIPPPVDRKRFRPIDVSPRPFFVCASGPFTEAQLEQRGVGLLFRAFAKLHANGIPVQLRYIGRWSRGHQLLEEIAEKNHADNVQIDTGYCDDLPNIISRSCGVIVPYVGTGDAPLSAIEAICCGRPVIITKGPGLAEDIHLNGAGIVVNPCENEIADAVQKIWSDPARFSQNALQMASAFDAGDYRKAHFALYRDLYRANGLG